MISLFYEMYIMMLNERHHEEDILSVLDIIVN